MNAHVMHHLPDVGRQGAAGVFACFRDASQPAVLGCPRIGTVGVSLRFRGFEVWTSISQQLRHFLVNFLCRFFDERSDRGMCRKLKRN
jgi:hypothetical protein